MKMTPEVISELASKAALKQVAEGTHPFLGGEVSRKNSKNIQLKRVAEGTHHFLGPEMNAKKVADGTHNLVGNVSCIDKQGISIQVPREVYQKQKEITKDQTQYEFAMINSSEGKRRKTLV
jgi:hypothetical protein